MTVKPKDLYKSIRRYQSKIRDRLQSAAREGNLSGISGENITTRDLRAYYEHELMMHRDGRPGYKGDSVRGVLNISREASGDISPLHSSDDSLAQEFLARMRDKTHMGAYHQRLADIKYACKQLKKGNAQPRVWEKLGMNLPESYRALAHKKRDINDESSLAVLEKIARSKAYNEFLCLPVSQVAEHFGMRTGDLRRYVTWIYSVPGVEGQYINKRGIEALLMRRKSARITPDLPAQRSLEHDVAEQSLVSEQSPPAPVAPVETAPKNQPQAPSYLPRPEPKARTPRPESRSRPIKERQDDAMIETSKASAQIPAAPDVDQTRPAQTYVSQNHSVSVHPPTQSERKERLAKPKKTLGVSSEPELLPQRGTPREITPLDDEPETLEEIVVGGAESDSEEATHTRDFITMYTKEARKHPLLTPDEEVLYGRRAHAGNLAARQRLINSNYLLTLKIAKRYAGPKLALLEALSLANEGLMRAAETYNPDFVKDGKTFKFGTYLGHWVKQKIMDHLARDSGLSHDVYAKTRRINIAIETLTKRGVIQSSSEMGDEVLEQVAELASTEKSVLNSSKVKELMGYAAHAQMTSLDATTGQGGNKGGLVDEGVSVGDAVADSSAISPEGAAMHAVKQQTIASVVGELKDRERDIVIRRFGLDGLPPETLEEIGDRMGVTRERVRQIEEKALTRLRHPSRSKRLEDFDSDE